MDGKFTYTYDAWHRLVKATAAAEAGDEEDSTAEAATGQADDPAGGDGTIETEAGDQGGS